MRLPLAIVSGVLLLFLLLLVSLHVVEARRQQHRIRESEGQQRLRTTSTSTTRFTSDVIESLPPVEQRIEQILAQMTLEEKVNQLLIPEVGRNE